MDKKYAPSPAFNQTDQPPQGYAPPIPQRNPAGQAGYTGQQATVVIQQPYPGETIVHQDSPRNYYIFSLFVCLCCFWPTGLCAMYYASRSTTLLADGNIAEASRMAKIARNLVITSVVLGLCVTVSVIVVQHVLVSSIDTTSTYSY